MRKEEVKKDNKKDFFQKGVILIWSLLVSLVILVIAFTLVILTVKELRISSNVDESNRAYMATEAGMEWALFRVKNEINNNISWCPPQGGISREINLNNTGEPELKYEVKIIGECNYSRIITITSRGVSRQTTYRKLKTKLTLVPPNNIDRFEKEGNLSFVSFSYFKPDRDRDPSYSIPQTSLIIQQFDLSNLSRNNIDNNGFTVGMSSGSNYSTNSTDFGVRITKASNSSVSFSLVGKINNTIISPINSFYFVPNQDTIYRVKLEYSRQGNYTVLRAVLLERKIKGEQEVFECIGTSKGYIVYAGVATRGSNPSYVKIDQGKYIAPHSSNYYDGYVEISKQGVKLDNLVFWGRE